MASVPALTASVGLVPVDFLSVPPVTVTFPPLMVIAGESSEAPISCVPRSRTTFTFGGASAVRLAASLAVALT
ncbi:hypothetical protein Rcae01_06478 [Novipirellula caenicola]|uniref:Secreted protein n=1 Tax=Novipirellula caenicola TaxID=1536901 RepID=A0ABP9W1T6_9BACT